jgi:hypothetical protein
VVWIGSSRRLAQTAFAIAMALLFVLAPLICIRICELRTTVTRAHATYAHGAAAINHAARNTTSHDASRAPAPILQSSI